MKKKLDAQAIEIKQLEKSVNILITQLSRFTLATNAELLNHENRLVAGGL